MCMRVCGCVCVVVTAVIRENRTIFCCSPKGDRPNIISVFVSPSSELLKERNYGRMDTVNGDD